MHPPSRSGFTLALALANSCNYYFTVLSLQLTAEALSHWYSAFGFGQAAEGNGPPTGRVAVGSDVRRKALAALGETDVVATPAQVLEAYSAVARRGEFRVLWTTPEGRGNQPNSRRIHLRPSTVQTLIKGLVGCVQFGTCQEAAVPGVRVAGKTGTATALDGSGATHAWFVGFAPADNPEIAIVVFLNRGTGAHSAAPLAGAILREYFAGRNQLSGLQLDSFHRARVVILALSLLTPSVRISSAQVFHIRISSRADRQAKPAGIRGPREVSVAVDLDQYLEGVLTGEASTLKSSEALDAMAVIVRTWALRNRGRHQAQGFDFCDLTHCQVFRRARDSSGHYSDEVMRAVRETRDEILEYHGQLVDPYFSADCGGVTESAGEVWPDKDLPYLPAAPDPYCAGSSHSSWQRAVSLETLEMILRHDMTIPIGGPLRDVTVASRDSSSRAHTLAVEADTRLLIDANQFRYAVDRRLGWGEIKSNLYTIERRGGDLVFTGRGLGHGVGLCQAGADARGRLGISYKRILAQYFPGATVLRLPSSVTPDPVASSERFELVFPEGQRRWVSESLNELEQSRKELPIPVDAWPPMLRVQTWNRTVDFVNETGEPGWVAGTNDGKLIFLQPLGALARKGILKATLRHELAHVAIHRLCSPGIPPWFEEGLALYLTAEQIDVRPYQLFSRRSLGEAIARPKSEAEMRQAYARASLLVRSLARRRGQDAVWQVLEHPTATDINRLKTESEQPLAP